MQLIVKENNRKEDFHYVQCNYNCAPIGNSFSCFVTSVFLLNAH